MSSTNTTSSVLPSEVLGVKTSGFILNLQIVSELITNLQKELKGIDLKSNILNPAVLEYILSKVQTCIANLESSEGLDLKDVTTSIIKALVPAVTDEQLKTIATIIDYIIKNDLLTVIKNKSSLQKLKAFFVLHKRRK
jgi:hypothetical protein